MKQTLKNASYVCAGPILGGVLAALAWHYTHPNPAPIVSTPVALHTTVDEILAGNREFVGNPAGAYTLVEFADYQCPPCAMAQSDLREVISHYGASLRLAFRNYPLSSMHPNAMGAAIAAEQARLQGKFWAFHDALYLNQKQLSPAYIAVLSTSLHLDSRKAARDEQASKSRVQQDIAAAKAFKVYATPTFILCCPDGRILSGVALAHLGDYIKPNLR